MKPNLRSSFSSSSSHYRRRNQKELIDFLARQFDFTYQLAILVLALHQCSDLAQLMSLFVLNDNNKYAHIFIPNQQNSNMAICKICQESRTYHIEQITWQGLKQVEQQIKNTPKFQLEQEKYNSRSYSGRFKQQQGQKLCKNFEKYTSLIEDQISIMCSICYVNNQENQMVELNGSCHEVCISCMAQYLKQEILNLRIEHLKCPHCQILLTVDFVKEYVSNVIFEKYLTFSRNIQIHKNPNLKWCPNPKCSVVISTSKSKTIIKCPKCNTMVCTKCNQEAHPKLSCNQVIQNIFKDLQNAKDIQKCRKCKALVQKIAGCNHMTCRVCKYEWCWLCGSTYSDIHFSPLNPLGCAGMQNRNISTFSKCKIYVLRVLMIIGFLALLPIFISLCMIFCGPVVVYQFIRNNCSRLTCCGEILLAIFFCFPIGVVIDPLVWIGAIIYYMPLICTYIQNWFQRRRNIIEGSQNQIKKKFLEEGEAVVVTE